MSQNVLHVENVTMQFGGVVAVNDLSLEVNQGEIVALIGPNGAGKTTAFNCITGVYEPTNGKIDFMGQPMIESFPQGKMASTYLGEHKGLYTHKCKPSPDQITQLGIARTFQNIRLFSSLTVLENVLIAKHMRAKQNVFSATFRLNRKEEARMREEAAALLEEQGLLHLKDEIAGSLPYGLQRHLEIARALATDPKLLLLDEPLGALDLKLRQDMQYELIRLKNELGITFIYVTHDQEEALTMSDTIVVMNQGYIQQIGTPEDIYNEPENAFVADFIGDSNIFNAIMVRDKLVNIVGAEFPCVDTGFGTNKPVDAVIRPEDIDLVKPEEGTLKGVVTHLIFKGVHYEMEVLANNYEWLVHSTDMFPVGTEVGIHVDPFDIQIMKKPESEDEEAAGIEE